MSNNQIPAWLLNDVPPDSVNEDLKAGLGMSSQPYISIENQRFALVFDNGDRQEIGEYDKKIGLYIDVCIIDTNRNISRVFYDRKANPYEPGAANFNPPECWSDNGYAPSANCSKPQWSVCATCPKAEWGSDVSQVSGKDIPACRSYKKIAVGLADNMLPVGDPALDDAWLMRIPPNSHKNMRPYVEFVSSKMLGTRHLTVTDIVTRVSFQSQGTLNFNSVSLINERLGALRKRVWTGNEADAIVGRTDKAISEEKQRAIVAERKDATAIESQPASSEQAQTQPPAGSIARQAIEKRAEATARAAQGGQQAQVPATRGQRGRPKTVAPAPKQTLQTPAELAGDPGPMPDFLKRNGENDANRQANQDELEHLEDHEKQEAEQHFGIAQNAAEPPSALDAQLDALMGSTVPK